MFRSALARAVPPAIFMAGLTSCAKHSEAPPAPVPIVHTVIASFGTIYPRERLAGIITPYQNVAIQSTLTEPADTVAVNEGDRVRRGQLLAQLDTADLQATLDADLATAQGNQASTSRAEYAGGLSIAQGQDAVRSAEAALQQANASASRDQADLRRYRSLVSNGYISQQQVDQLATTVRNDEQTIRANEAALASARQNVTANGSLGSGGLQSSTVEQSRATVAVALAQAQQQRVQIGKATIVSPIDGVIVNRNLNPGEYPGTRQLFTIQQIDPVYAVLRGSSAQIANIENGAVVAVSTGQNARRRAGHVVGVLNQVDPGSTDFQVKVLLANADGRLRPGMAVAADVALTPARGVRIPATAFIDDNHNSVMAVARDGTVKTVPVTEGTGDRTTVVVTGIAPGTRVITDGQTSVGNGQKVAFR